MNFFTPLSTAKSPEKSILDSTGSVIPWFGPPMTPFSWPENLKRHIQQLYETGYVHSPSWADARQNYINGQNHHLGREVYEVYTCVITPTPTDIIAPAEITTEDHGSNLPDLSAFFASLVEFPIIAQQNDQGTAPPKFATHSVFPTEGDASTLIAVYHAGPNSQGHADLLHGGAIAAFFDTVMYSCITTAGRVAVTANLTTNYRTPTPVNTVLFAVASIKLTSERKAEVRVGLFSSDFNVLHADATALFVTPAAWVGVKPQDLHK